MDDSMIGEFITEQPMDEPMEMGTKPMPMLRRFVDYDKPIRYLKQLGAGAEGTVHRVIIEGREYALKLVSHYNKLTAFSEQPLIAYGCNSFYHGNGRRSALRSIQIYKFLLLFFLMNVEPLLAYKVSAKTGLGLSSVMDG